MTKLSPIEKLPNFSNLEHMSYSEIKMADKINELVEAWKSLTEKEESSKDFKEWRRKFNLRRACGFFEIELPTPLPDKAKCDCACHKMHAGPCENCWFCITSAQPDKAKCEHEWDGVNSKLWYCKKCGREFTEANPPQPDMEEMKDGICEILDDLPTSVSEKRIQHFSSAILDFLLANYNITKLKKGK